MQNSVLEASTGADTEAPRALLDLRNIVKTYIMGEQQVHALRNVSLQIDRGDFVAIMGASGSGKSTMMNILGCLDRPTAGSYYLDGQDVAKLSDDAAAVVRNRTIGFVFQSFNLLKRTSAQRNVELPLIYAGVPARERAERARAALEMVGLGNRLDHQPSQLSGGQQQRVAIARALVNNPSLILADEPTGNLDSQVSAEILALFQRLNTGRDLTIVLVTHEDDIASHARRVVRMRDGRVLSDMRQEPRPAVVPRPAESAGPTEVRSDANRVGPAPHEREAE